MARTFKVIKDYSLYKIMQDDIISKYDYYIKIEDIISLWGIFCDNRSCNFSPNSEDIREYFYKNYIEDGEYLHEE